MEILAAGAIRIKIRQRAGQRGRGLSRISTMSSGKRPAFTLDVKRLNSGAANPALNRNQVHPIEVDWPPPSRQKDIVVTLDALSQEIQRLESLYQRKLAALDELKKSLLHRAFTGQRLHIGAVQERYRPT